MRRYRLDHGSDDSAEQSSQNGARWRDGRGKWRQRRSWKKQYREQHRYRADRKHDRRPLQCPATLPDGVPVPTDALTHERCQRIAPRHCHHTSRRRHSAINRTLWTPQERKDQRDRQREVNRAGRTVLAVHRSHNPVTIENGS